MAGLYPNTNDNEQTAAFKMAENFYNLAFIKGIGGLNPPNYNDTEVILARKTAYYTAALSAL